MLFSSLHSRKLWRSLISASRRDHEPEVGVAAGKGVNSSIWHDQRTHDVSVQSDNFPTCPSWYCHSRNLPHMLQQAPLLPQWPPHTGACNTSAFILCNHKCKIIKVMGFFFCLEPLKFSVQITCDFSNFAATGSLLHQTVETTHPQESTQVLRASFYSATCNMVNNFLGKWLV